MGEVKILTFPEVPQKFKPHSTFLTLETQFSELSLSLPVEFEILRINDYLEENEEYYNQISPEEVEEAWLVEGRGDFTKIELLSEE